MSRNAVRRLSVTLVVLLATTAATTSTAQEVDVSPTSRSIDFGDVLLGAERSRRVTVTNRDSGTLTVSFAFTVRDPAPFSVSSTEPVFIRPGIQASVDVSFAPRTRGIATETLRITVGTLQQEFQFIDIPLRGNGVSAEARIAVKPDAVDFGDVIVGSRRRRTVTITNEGNVVLEVNGIFLDGDAFSISQEPATTRVVPGTGVDLELTFAPTRVGEDDGLLVINSNAFNNQSVRVPLTGTGIPLPEPEVDVRPPAVDFGATSVGSSRREEVQIRNLAEAPLLVSAIRLTSDSSPAFEIVSGPRSAEILAEGRVVVEVEYSPTAERADSGTLRIDTNDADEERIDVPLRGAGIVERSPEIRVLPAEVDFGETLVGRRKVGSVEIWNVGDAVLDVSEVAVVSDPDGVFSVSSLPRSLDVAPDGVLKVEVAYAPAAVGSDEASLRIRSNDEDEETVRVTLLGEGIPAPAPEIRVSPLALDFGETFLGASRRLEFTIRNTGSEVLEISDVFPGDGTSDDYSLGASPRRVDIAPGARVAIEVTLTPTMEGPHPGTIHVQSNDENEPKVVVSLLGEGVVERVPAIEVDPAELPFGSVSVGSSAVESLSVTNAGTAPLVLTRVSLGDNSSNHFVLETPADGLSIAPGAREAIEIAYTPGEEGFDSAAVRIESNDPVRGQVTVPVFGNGTPRPVPNITVDPGAVKLGSAPTPSSSTVAVTIGNTGTGDLAVATIDLGEGTSADFAVLGELGGFVVRPGEESVLEIEYSPSDAGADTGTLLIDSDDPDTPRTTVPLVGATFPPPTVTLEFPPDAGTPVESDGRVDDAELHETTIGASSEEDLILDGLVYTASEETPLDCVTDVMLFADLNENGAMDDGEVTTDVVIDEGTGEVAFDDLDIRIPKNKALAVRLIAGLLPPDASAAAVAPGPATLRVAGLLFVAVAAVAALGGLLLIRRSRPGLTRSCRARRDSVLALAAGALVVALALPHLPGCSSGGGGGGGAEKALDEKTFALIIKSLDDIRLVGADSGLTPTVDDFPAEGIPGTPYTITGD